MGMPDYRQEKHPQSLTVKVSDDERDTVAMSLEGTYHCLPRCGTAKDSLYKRANERDTQSPMFLFLDPDRTGDPDDDCFVFSHSAERLDYGGIRSPIATVQASWEPWVHGQTERTVSIALNSEWIDLAGANMLQPLPTDLEIREPMDHSSLSAGHGCDQWTELISCSVANATHSPVASCEIVSYDDNQFFSQNAWMFENLRRRLQGDM